MKENLLLLGSLWEIFPNSKDTVTTMWSSQSFDWENWFYLLVYSQDSSPDLFSLVGEI